MLCATPLYASGAVIMWFEMSDAHKVLRVLVSPDELTGAAHRPLMVGSTRQLLSSVRVAHSSYSCHSFLLLYDH